MYRLCRRERCNGAEVLPGVFGADLVLSFRTAGEKSHKVSLADTTSVSLTKPSWCLKAHPPVPSKASVDTAAVRAWKAINCSARHRRRRHYSVSWRAFGQYRLHANRWLRCHRHRKYERHSPTDDVRTASVSLTGTGKWTWFDIDAAAKAKAITANRTMLPADTITGSFTPLFIS